MKRKDMEINVDIFLQGCLLKPLRPFSFQKHILLYMKKKTYIFAYHSFKAWGGAGVVDLLNMSAKNANVFLGGSPYIDASSCNAYSLGKDAIDVVFADTCWRIGHRFPHLQVIWAAIL